MANESGDKKLIGNFRKLIDECAADPAYNPANDDLKIPALEAQYTAGDAAVSAMAAARAPNKLAITDRESAFGGLRPLAVGSRNFLKASGAPQGVLDDAETYIRKLGGGRKTPKVVDDPDTPEDESKKSSSASQMSYDNQTGNFQSYIEIVKHVASYNPNEADLKVTALIAYAASLTAKNNAVSTTTGGLEPGPRPARPVAVPGRRLDREHSALGESLRSGGTGHAEPVVQADQGVEVRRTA